MIRTRGWPLRKVLSHAPLLGLVPHPQGITCYSATTMRAASESGISAILDLTPVFRGAAEGGGPLFYRLDGAHWRPRAHGIAAEAIADWIGTAQLFPRSPRRCGS